MKIGNPKPHTIMALVAVFVLVSCDNKPGRSGMADDTTSLASALVGGLVPPAPSGRASDTALLAEAENSRAYLVTSKDNSAVVWWVREPTGLRLIWRSRDLLGASPTAKLQDLNRDGTADLFWSIEYEGLVGAVVVVRRQDGVTELFPDVDHCLRPELQSADDQHFIVAYLSGAYHPDDCEDPRAQVCLREFQITWPRFYRVEGQALVEFRRQPAFYRELSERYQRDAAELQRVVAAERGVDETKRVYQRCPAETPQRMRKLADSASMLARR